MSSAQKDIETYEGKGYTLLDETDVAGIHVLLFEKSSEGVVKEETQKNRQQSECRLRLCLPRAWGPACSFNCR